MNLFTILVSFFFFIGDLECLPVDFTFNFGEHWANQYTVQNGKKTFSLILNKGMVNWFEANTVCREFLPGGSLATIKSSDEEKQVQDYLKSVNCTNIPLWLGGASFNDTRVLRWIDDARPINKTFLKEKHVPLPLMTKCLILIGSRFNVHWDVNICNEINLPLCQRYVF